ncbi:hypothetical protein M569_17680, partial [Genlisea aurea]
DSCLWESLEDGLNALIRIETRGSKLHNRSSAIPPPLQAGTFSRGVITMRCDITTSSFAHISLLVSGSAQTCFDDQILENQIKSEIIDKSRLVHPLAYPDEFKPRFSEPRRSFSVACGADVFEVSLKVPTWASQIFRQLALDISYRNFAALGIASIQGLAVASFEKDDAERVSFFYPVREKNGGDRGYLNLGQLPPWLRPPPPSRNLRFETSSCSVNGGPVVRGGDDQNKEIRSWNGRQKVRIAALRPIPHVRHRKMLPFSATGSVDLHDGNQAKASLPAAPSKHHSGVVPTVGHRKSTSNSHQAKQVVVSLNPIPLKKHGCGRSSLHVCSE